MQVVAGTNHLIDFIARDERGKKWIFQTKVFEPLPSSNQSWKLVSYDVVRHSEALTPQLTAILTDCASCLTMNVETWHPACPGHEVAVSGDRHVQQVSTVGSGT